MRQPPALEPTVVLTTKELAPRAQKERADGAAAQVATRPARAIFARGGTRSAETAPAGRVTPVNPAHADDGDVDRERGPAVGVSRPGRAARVPGAPAWAARGAMAMIARRSRSKWTPERREVDRLAPGPGHPALPVPGPQGRTREHAHAALLRGEGPTGADARRLGSAGDDLRLPLDGGPRVSAPGGHRRLRGTGPAR